MKHAWRLVLILVITSLTGCGPSYHYKYSAPTTSEGNSCVQRCTEVRNQCRHVTELEEKSNQALNQANQRNYQSCAAGRSKKDINKYCNTASDGFSGFNNFSPPSCEEDFHQCFQICGGSIQRILESN